MVSSSPRIVVATHNRGKLREFRVLLQPAGFDVIGLPDLSISRVVAETGESFAENARLKALAYAEETDFPVLADDSGLEVFALGCKPGIESARYAGPDASDHDRVRKLLDELKRTRANRAARFVCALALARRGAVLLEVEGECHGEIALEPRGTNGFGYDPIFRFPDLGKTFAELDEAEKNHYSHRAHAVRALLARISPAGLVAQTRKLG